MVQGGVLDPESDDLLQSSSSHSDWQGGQSKVTSCGREGFVFTQSHSLLLLGTPLGYISQLLAMDRPCG